MTDYSDFIRDFPARCGEVLSLFYRDAQATNREVTLLVMTAAAAFIFPYERLRPGMSAQHSSRDRENFPDEAKRLDLELRRPFIKCRFHEGDHGSWSVGKMIQQQAEADAFKPISKDTQASQVLANIRNALAHGNLWTIPDANSDIGALVFWAEDRSNDTIVGYKYVRVTPADFHAFLLKWFAFLIAEKLPAGVVAETLAQAANAGITHHEAQ